MCFEAIWGGVKAEISKSSSSGWVRVGSSNFSWTILFMISGQNIKISGNDYENKANFKKI